MCNNGVCGGLCNSNGDCPSNMKCGATEYPLDLDDPEDDVYDVYLPLGTCIDMPGATTACASTSECGGKYCKPWTYAVAMAGGATATSGSKYSSGGLCIDPDPKKKGFGELCGQAANATLCNSGLCLNTRGQDGSAQPGFCVDICNAASDCKPTVTLPAPYNVEMKSICRSLLFGWNGTKSPLDDLYVPVCMPASKASSLADCSANKTCSSANEACLAYPVVFRTRQIGHGRLPLWFRSESTHTKQSFTATTDTQRR